MTANRNVSLKLILGAAVAVLALTAGSLVAAHAFTRTTTHVAVARFSNSCTAPSLSGSTVSVTLTDMRMGGRGNMMDNWMTGRSGFMQVTANPSTVKAGTVSLVVTNTGYMTHELVVLPLASGAVAGQRPIDSNNKVDESTSVGEASNNCGEGQGSGINPGSTSWVTMQLQPGSYELVCNLAGHYRAGMFTTLQVTS